MQKEWSEACLTECRQDKEVDASLGRKLVPIRNLTLENPLLSSFFLSLLVRSLFRQSSARGVCGCGTEVKTCRVRVLGQRGKRERERERRKRPTVFCKRTNWTGLVLVMAR